MKNCLFIYRDDREASCDPDYRYSNRLVLVDQEFPGSTADWDIVEAARSHEVKDLLQDKNTASEGVFNRRLLRVIEMAREIPFLVE